MRMTVESSPIPPDVHMAAVQACRLAFHWRDDVEAVFIGAGVPQDLYRRHNEPGASKAKIASGVLRDLGAAGRQGHGIQRRIVEQLCRLTKPHPDAPDQRAGREALAALKAAAAEEGLLVTPANAAADARKANREREEMAKRIRVSRLGELRSAFLELHKTKVRTDAERQERGYALERLLADLFRLNDLEYRPSYRTAHDQVDGYFQFRGFPYLLEAKWRIDMPSYGDLVTFKAKVDKFDGNRGVFVSMAGFDEDTLVYVMTMTRGTRNNLILFDGRDVSLLFEGAIGLLDALSAKVNAAEQEGQMWHRLLT